MIEQRILNKLEARKQELITQIGGFQARGWIELAGPSDIPEDFGRFMIGVYTGWGEAIEAIQELIGEMLLEEV